MDEQLLKKSRFLSRILRHRPDSIGITLNKQGWTEVSELLEKAAAHEMHISREELERIVAENDKQRFSLNADQSRIRAAQGHSVPVALKLPVRIPPPVLYHGTVAKFLPSIRKQGLLPGTRQDVHLSETRETAMTVGARRGKPVVLVIETYPMIKGGLQFRQADNGVWLAACIPAKYLCFPEA